MHAKFHPKRPGSSEVRPADQGDETVLRPRLVTPVSQDIFLQLSLFTKSTSKLKLCTKLGTVGPPYVGTPFPCLKVHFYTQKILYSKIRGFLTKFSGSSRAKMGENHVPGIFFPQQRTRGLYKRVLPLVGFFSQKPKSTESSDYDALNHQHFDASSRWV